VPIFAPVGGFYPSHLRMQRLPQLHCPEAEDDMFAFQFTDNGFLYGIGVTNYHQACPFGDLYTTYTVFGKDDTSLPCGLITNFVKSVEVGTDFTLILFEDGAVRGYVSRRKDYSTMLICNSSTH
jgi:hypothetical protein